MIKSFVIGLLALLLAYVVQAAEPLLAPASESEPSSAQVALLPFALTQQGYDSNYLGQACQNEFGVGSRIADW